MQIVVNTRLLLKDRLEGIGWFTYQTLSRITRSNPDVHFVFLFDRSFAPEFIFSDNVTPIILSPQARHPILYYAFFQHSVKRILNTLKPEAFFSPDGFLSLGADCAQIPVIHDINFLHYPKDTRWLTAKYYNYYFPRFASEASRIVTVSEFSKRDISKSFHIDPSKIDVVYNGINEGFRKATDEEKKATRAAFSQGSEYFLHVGSLHPRKNIPGLIKGFTEFKRKRGSDKKLLLAGPEFWGLAEIRRAVKESPYKSDIVFTGRVSQEDLNRIVSAAFCLCMVSFYEGFGIPLVEAMACEVPVLSSRSSALPEIGGNAAHYIDPESSEDIANGLLKIEADPEYSKILIENGLQQKEKFNWDRSAKLLWESIYLAATAKPSI